VLLDFVLISRRIALSGTYQYSQGATGDSDAAYTYVQSPSQLYRMPPNTSKTAEGSSQLARHISPLFSSTIYPRIPRLVPPYLSVYFTAYRLRQDPSNSCLVHDSMPMRSISSPDPVCSGIPFHVVRHERELLSYQFETPLRPVGQNSACFRSPLDWVVADPGPCNTVVSRTPPY
jgi:hypothetical protein